MTDPDLKVLPWQVKQWQSLQQSVQQDRLPHGLLLQGPAGVGKFAFARLFAQTLLCQQPESVLVPASSTEVLQPCGQCSSCQLIAAGNHPDFQIIEPEKDGGQIKVDQIRALIESTSLSSQYNGYKVIIINPAEAMNISAANSLLKTLEEPPQKTLLILVARQISRLPATIRSRCQMRQFALPETKQAIEWLKIQLSDQSDSQIGSLLEVAEGAPLHAREYAGTPLLEQQQAVFEDFRGLAQGRLDPVHIANEWLKHDHLLPINWLYSWVSDMIRLKQAGDNKIRYAGRSEALQSLAQDVDLKRLFALLDQTTEALQLVNQLNPLAIIEKLLIYWVNLPRAKTLPATP